MQVYAGWVLGFRKSTRPSRTWSERWSERLKCVAVSDAQQGLTARDIPTINWVHKWFSSCQIRVFSQDEKHITSKQLGPRFTNSLHTWNLEGSTSVHFVRHGAELSRPWLWLFQGFVQTTTLWWWSWALLWWTALDDQTRSQHCLIQILLWPVCVNFKLWKSWNV